MVLMTLDRMARGGIRDQLGGGYHRYSTDRYWLVPHFEKMLYDNAQLASVHLAAFEITHDPRWRDEAEATFAFVARKLTAPEGGFYSSLDAETKGEEGAYYVWTRDEVKAVLGDGRRRRALRPGLRPRRESRTSRAAATCFMSPGRAPQQAEAQQDRPSRSWRRGCGRCAPSCWPHARQRPAPLCDDKVLTGWNGLMIAAYADGYRVLKDEKYRQAAEKAAGFVLDKLRTPERRPVADLPRGPGQAARLPRRLRLSGARAASAARGDRRRQMAA